MLCVLPSLLFPQLRLQVPRNEKRGSANPFPVYGIGEGGKIFKRNQGLCAQYPCAKMKPVYLLIPIQLVVAQIVPFDRALPILISPVAQVTAGQELFYQ